MLGAIIRLQLGRIDKRVREGQGIPFTYDDAVVKLIASRCTELESGGRMIDAILTNSVLPVISAEILRRLIDGRQVGSVHIGVDKGEFSYAFGKADEA
jgi:type VI secretion system protein VasG